jgi:hypothetical protein
MQAGAAILHDPGARAHYDELRARDTGHNAALRQLGNRLVGILHGCLKTHTTTTPQPPGHTATNTSPLDTKLLGCLTQTATPPPDPAAVNANELTPIRIRRGADQQQLSPLVTTALLTQTSASKNHIPCRLSAKPHLPLAKAPARTRSPMMCGAFLFYKESTPGRTRGTTQPCSGGAPPGDQPSGERPLLANTIAPTAGGALAAWRAGCDRARPARAARRVASSARPGQATTTSPASSPRRRRRRS